MHKDKSTGKFFLFFILFIIGSAVAGMGGVAPDIPIALRIVILIVGITLTVFGLAGMGRHNDASSKGPFNFGN